MIEIPDALSALGVSVERQPYTGSANQYVLFNLTHHGHSDWASGKAIQDEWIYAVHLFSRGNFKALAKLLLKLLREAGWTVTEGPELYEEDTQYHHLVFDARCWEDIEEEPEESNG